MEGYFEQVVETLDSARATAGTRPRTSASTDRRAGRDLRASHNLGYWRGRDYLGHRDRRRVHGRRRAAAEPSEPRRATSRALAAGGPPPCELEPIDAETRARERLMLGLRLDEPLPPPTSSGAARPRGARAARRAPASSSWRRTARRGDAPDASRALPRRRRDRRARSAWPTERLRRCAAGLNDCTRLPSDGDAAHSAKARDPRRVIEEYVATGQPVGSKRARRALGARRLVVDRARRARRARGARPADASAHVGGPDADRERVPGLRRRARRPAGGSSCRARRRPPRSCATRSRRRCA